MTNLEKETMELFKLGCNDRTWFKGTLPETVEGITAAADEVGKIKPCEISGKYPLSLRIKQKLKSFLSKKKTRPIRSLGKLETDFAKENTLPKKSN